MFIYVPDLDMRKGRFLFFYFLNFFQPVKEILENLKEDTVSTKEK